MHSKGLFRAKTLTIFLRVTWASTSRIANVNGWIETHASHEVGNFARVDEAILTIPVIKEIEDLSYICVSKRAGAKRYSLNEVAMLLLLSCPKKWKLNGKVMECVRYSIGFGGYRCTRSNEFKHLKRSLVIEKCVREFIGFRERLLHKWYQIS